MASMDRATAEHELIKFLDDWELDLESNIDEDTSKVIEKQKGQLIKAFESGKLTFGDGELKFQLRDEGVISFMVPKANAYLETDRSKDHEYMKKLYNFMGAMTGKPPKILAKMDARDSKVAQAIVGLFMNG